MGTPYLNKPLCFLAHGPKVLRFQNPLLKVKPLFVKLPANDKNSVGSTIQVGFVYRFPNIPCFQVNHMNILLMYRQVLTLFFVTKLYRQEAALDKVGRSDELHSNIGNGTRYNKVRRNSYLNSWLQRS